MPIRWWVRIRTLAPSASRCQEASSSRIRTSSSPARGSRSRLARPVALAWLTAEEHSTEAGDVCLTRFFAQTVALEVLRDTIHPVVSIFNLYIVMSPCAPGASKISKSYQTPDSNRISQRVVEKSSLFFCARSSSSFAP